MAVTRFSSGLVRRRTFRVDVAAVAGAAAGCFAALAILTASTVAAAIAAIGLAVVVVTLRQPSPWLTTTNDLTTLSLSDDDLDACLAAACGYGLERRSSEREAVLDSVTLVLPGHRWRGPGVPIVRFRVRESDGRGWHILTFDRPPPRPATFTIGASGGDGVDAATDAPWRLDPSWRRLVTISWMRMQPFVGTVILGPLSSSRRRRRHWEIEYRSTGPAGRGQTTSFRLRSTGLYRPARTSRAEGAAAAGHPGPN